MGNNPQKNHFIDMKWIMTCKDRFSGFCWLCCLTKKAATDVAHELNILFADVGYPHIFHTDNGKEFTTDLIVKLLKSYHPSVVTVTGRPRTPCDQGSVENANRQVKDILGRIELHLCSQGIQPNWTELLQQVQTTMNSLPQKNFGKATCYETLYGKIYDPPTSNTM